MTNIPALIAKNGALWERAKNLPERAGEVNAIAEALTAPGAKARYQTIAAVTGVPWWGVAVIHERAPGQNSQCQLGQGDPLDRPSHRQP